MPCHAVIKIASITDSNGMTLLQLTIKGGGARPHGCSAFIRECLYMKKNIHHKFDKYTNH